MKRIAVISAIIESPKNTQTLFNEVVSSYKSIIKGRMGLPFDNENVAVISITVMAELNIINEFTGKLGQIDNINVKTVISKKEY